MIVMQVKPPRKLLFSIFSRIKLEKTLFETRKQLKWFIFASSIFLAILVFAILGLRDIMKETSIGLYISLFFSDTAIILKNWRAYILSIFESLPGESVVLFLTALGLLLVFVRIMANILRKLLLIVKTIKSRTYGQR